MSTRGFSSFRRKLKRGARKIERSEDIIPPRAGHKGVSSIKRNLIEQDLVVSTELWRSVGFRVPGRGFVVIEATADHAGFVEHGTGVKGDGLYPAADNVPTSQILKWMHEKPTFATSGNPWVNIDTAETIARSLETEGQRQQEFFDPAFEDAKDRAKQMLRLRFATAF